MDMKLFVAIFVLALVKADRSDPTGNDDDKWNEYRRRYKKTYTNGIEENMRSVKSNG
jgi:hypothetical protein